MKKNNIIAQRTLKKSIDTSESLNECLNKYQKALGKVMDLRKSDLSELKSFKSPPESAISVVFFIFKNVLQK